MAWIDQLVDQDLLLRTGDYRVLKLTDRGLAVLRSEAEAKLYDVVAAGGSAKRSRRSRAKPETPRVRTTSTGKRERRKAPKVGPDATQPAVVPSRRTTDPGEHYDSEAVVLFGKLRELRRTIADKRNVPAYRVFSDKTLREMARARPTGTEAFLEISGVGPVKYKQFGRRFIDIIRSHVGQ